jgi:hypothetical protein
VSSVAFHDVVGSYDRNMFTTSAPDKENLKSLGVNNPHCIIHIELGWDKKTVKTLLHNVFFLEFIVLIIKYNRYNKF